MDGDGREGRMQSRGVCGETAPQGMFERKQERGSHDGFFRPLFVTIRRSASVVLPHLKQPPPARMNTQCSLSFPRQMRSLPWHCTPIRMLDPATGVCLTERWPVTSVPFNRSSHHLVRIASTLQTASVSIPHNVRIKKLSSPNSIPGQEPRERGSALSTR